MIIFSLLTLSNNSVKILVTLGLQVKENITEFPDRQEKVPKAGLILTNLSQKCYCLQHFQVNCGIRICT